MANLLHIPAVRERLRRARPVYNVLFRRKKNYDRLPSPKDYLQEMKGRGVFLLCFGRSGSTVFADYLASHPSILTFGEILGEDSYYSYFQWLSRHYLWFWPLRPTMMAREFYRFCAHLVRKHPERRCLFDIKIESLHLIEGNWRLPGPDFAFLHNLRATNTPVILLTRKDLIARYISGQVAERRGSYHSYQTSTIKPAPFKVDLETIQAQVTQINATYTYIRRFFADHPCFVELAYEDLFTSDGTSFARDLGTRMAALLKVPNQFDHSPKLKKISSTKGYYDMLLNYTEVETYRNEILGQKP